MGVQLPDSGAAVLPPAIGRPALRALEAAGMRSLTDVSQHTESELLALHGVGPRAIRLLRTALAERGLEFRAPS